MIIAQKLGVAAPTATRHVQVLARAGLVTSRRARQWTFYRPAADPMDLIQREFGGEE
jgi:ArsR family transcriptional regulator